MKKIMEIYRDIEEKTMTDEKRKSAKNDYFAFYIGRPLSYFLTIPLLNKNVSPNTVTIFSIVPLIIGSVIMSLTTNKFVLFLSWCCFFLWNLLDGVDGNLARYRKQFSKNGSVLDATAGYLCMYLLYFSSGIAATCITENNLYTILGSLSGLFVIFPRLIMHKYISSVGNDKSASKIKDKSSFSFSKVIALNFTSITGFPQIFLLISILTNQLPLFTVIYLLINFIVMMVSLFSLFKQGEK